MKPRNSTLLALAAVTAMVASAAEAQISSAQQNALRANCRSDFMSHCSGVTPGSKDALLCLQKNVDALSSGCQAAVRSTMPAPAAAAKPPSAPSIQTAAPPPAAAPATPPAPAAAPAAAASPPPAPAAAATPASPAAPPPSATSAPPKVRAAAPPSARPVKPAVTVAAPVPAATAVAGGPSPEQLKALKFTCRGDFRRLCKNVPQGPEAFVCLQSHAAQLSPNCKTSVADIAASMPASGAIPAATPVAVKPAPVPHQPKAPLVDTAVMLRACKLDLIRHCRDAGFGGGQKLACLTAHEADLTFRCRAAMKVSSPLH